MEIIFEWSSGTSWNHTPHKFQNYFGVRGENGKTQRTVNPSIAGSSPVDRLVFLKKDVYFYIQALLAQ